MTAIEPNSGYGVLSKAFALLKAVEQGAAAPKELSDRTGISRPTTYRLISALHAEGLLARDGRGGWMLGSRLHELARQAKDSLQVITRPIMQQLHEETGESVQLYRRIGQRQVCVASIVPASGLRDSAEVGEELDLAGGAGGQILLAYQPSTRTAGPPVESAFSMSLLRQVKRRGWAESVGEQIVGVASVSAPVTCPDGSVLALCLSGPISRLSREPGKRYAAQVVRSAKTLTEML